MEYAELQCRTHYSFLRGASHPRELVERARELGLRGLAITDLDGVYGIPKAYVAAQDASRLEAASAFKLIVGSEITIDGRAPVLLLARDRAGYGLLCRIITASRADKPKGEAGLSREALFEFLARPAASGLFALPRLEGSGVAQIAEGHGAAVSFESDLATLRDLLPGSLYLPVSRFLDGRDRERVEFALALSRRLGRPLVATNDVHYHVRERSRLQDSLAAIRENCSLEQLGGGLFQNPERYLKSPKQMTELFRELPQALGSTLEISEACTFSPAELRYRYPSEWIPPDETAQSHLEKLTWKGAEGRYPEGIPEDVRAQLRHEFRLIDELGFGDYFLTIWEIVEFARARKILCQGRGSAANSAVCFCLGITAVDPVRMKLLFERFLSAERGEPPDIDVDFEHERREEVIQHIYEKYGRDRAGMVSAIITYRSKSAVRDIGKALGYQPEEIEDGVTIENDERAQGLIEEIMGFPRHLSIHSGGFTLSADPLIETVPIEPARMEGRTIVQWDKEDLAAIGLLKVDVLALGMLTAIRKTLDLIPEKPYALATIPAEDQATYRMMQKADTVGVFQIESRAQMSMLPRLLPKTFYDVVIQVAIVRPGPIVGQMVHPFLRRRRGLESSASPDPRLEPILSRTLGVPLFQEQVMKMAIVMAGFTGGEADELRRAIGAWRSSGSLEKMGKKLMKGLLESGLPKEFVERIFLQIQGFAEYGFPESHAASFALLAYASSYLKCHHPTEFACALLNSQPMGFYSNHTLVEDAKRHGVRVLPIDPDHSEWDCTIEGGALRIGLRVVRGLGSDAAERIVSERRRARFTGLADFVTRTGLRLNVLYHLAMGEAFSSFGLDQRSALWAILHAHAPASRSADEQPDLFAELEGVRGEFSRLSDYQAIQADYQAFGLSVRGHPMDALRRALSGKIPPTTTQAAKRAPGGRGVRLAGLVIVRQRPPTAKGTVFATLEDESGFLDLILHKETYEKYGEVFNDSPFLVVSGRIQKDGESISMIVRRVERIPLNEELGIHSRDFH